MTKDEVRKILKDGIKEAKTNPAFADRNHRRFLSGWEEGVKWLAKYVSERVAEVEDD